MTLKKEPYSKENDVKTLMEIVSKQPRNLYAWLLLAELGGFNLNKKGLNLKPISRD